MAAFAPTDPAAVVAAARVREKARALVELWAKRAALELGKHRGARLSAVREHWDRVGFFLFIEPLGNSWLGVDLSPEHPLMGRYAAPRAPLGAAEGRLRGEGMSVEGEEWVGRVPLPPGAPLETIAEVTFAPLWKLWDICHALAGVEDGG